MYRPIYDNIYSNKAEDEKYIEKTDAVKKELVKNNVLLSREKLGRKLQDSDKIIFYEERSTDHERALKQEGVM